MKPTETKQVVAPSARRTYWFKCPADLYDQSFMLQLELLENSDRLQNIAIKIFCHCVARAPLQNKVGRLKLDDGAHYSEGVLARLLRVDLDHMRVAVKIFQDLGLLRYEKDGTLRVNWIAAQVGSKAASSFRSDKSRYGKELNGRVGSVAKQHSSVALQPRSIDSSLPPEGEENLSDDFDFESELEATKALISELGKKKR